MTDIKTLIKDIYGTIDGPKNWFTNELASHNSTNLAARLQDHFGERKGQGTLRLSKMGPVCPKALWHSVHTPELEEPLPAWARIKYAYGHMIEALAISLAKASGHEVTGEQDAVYVDGIAGHRDCVIDGCIVDVKSASSRGFIKFKKGTLAQDDSFGYLDQLDGYVVGSYEDPLVRVKDKGYILAVDKTLGHMVLYEHRVREDSIRSKVAAYKHIVAAATPPSCTCRTVEFGKSGNRVLDLKASYSSFRHTCFPRLRTFIYSDGPVYFTEVVKRPKDTKGQDMMEINREGKPIL